jgi:hypothetical protein
MNFEKEMKVFVGQTQVDTKNILSVETIGFDGNDSICELRFIAPAITQRGSLSFISFVFN